MTFTVNNRKLLFNKQEIVEFDYPVKAYLVFFNDKCVVILLDDEKMEKENSIRNRNVFCVDMHGKLLWQVDKREHIYDDSPYINLSKKDGNVRLHNWDGTVYITAPLTGKLQETYWLK